MAERADAARNRQAILAAAERLIIERGPDAVTMDEIALAAGVGKGTLFRRFGDRCGLLRELLDQYRGEVTDKVDTACADTADPVDRLLAYLGVLFDESQRLRPLVAALEAEATPGSCCRSAAGRHRVLAEWITRANPARAGSADFLAHALLAAMRAELVRHLTEDLGTPLARVRADLLALARASVISETVATA
ncbi:TetR/AcrR family transcriptional regulator [Crossiella cryophila]|uniref:AcrR family transcriptional regulator n=1 Tax=Crossiella cryophila TaxID=43355 RepID=A0A7W7CIP9_9PSEU|nr:TetR/AcrR family transcriptional regulator [Crossiella cryophila]MBB4681943.1 AcrR family transcriptional regulator [Crossiella cryophila]